MIKSNVKYFQSQNEIGFEMIWKIGDRPYRLTMVGFNDIDDAKMNAKRLAKKLGMRVDKVDR